MMTTFHKNREQEFQDTKNSPNDRVLYLQIGEYRYTNEEQAKGFPPIQEAHRFIWRTSEGKEQIIRERVGKPSISEGFAFIKVMLSLK